MLLDLIPWRISIDTVTIASACIWALALYLGLASFKEWITEQLYRWFNFAERFMYTSVQEFEKTRVARESQNAFYASLFSIMPFLALGIAFNYAVEYSLGISWSLSLAMLACVASAVYDLGRRNTQ